VRAKKNICGKIEIFGEGSKKYKLHSTKKRRAYYIPGILSIVQLNIFPASFMSDSSAVFIIIRHKSGLDRPVSASSTVLFQGLQSRLRPFGL
jgi:hypothetical protein